MRIIADESNFEVIDANGVELYVASSRQEAQAWIDAQPSVTRLACEEAVQAIDDAVSDRDIQAARAWRVELNEIIEDCHREALLINEGYDLARRAPSITVTPRSGNLRPDGLPYFHDIARGGVVVGNVYHSSIVGIFTLEIGDILHGGFLTLHDAMKEAMKILR